MGYYPELTVEDCRSFRSASFSAWRHNDSKYYSGGEDIASIFGKTNGLWDFVDEIPPREISNKLSAVEINQVKRIVRRKRKTDGSVYECSCEACKKRRRP